MLLAIFVGNAKELYSIFYIGFNMVLVISNILKAQKNILQERSDYKAFHYGKIFTIRQHRAVPCPTFRLDKPERVVRG